MYIGNSLTKFNFVTPTHIFFALRLKFLMCLHNGVQDAGSNFDNFFTIAYSQ